MALNVPEKLGSVLGSIYLVCVFFFLLSIAYNHIQLITHDFPLDYNEGGMLVFTATIAEGGNPYSLESQPSHISLYPVLYNIVVAPFSGILGNTLELHRAISGLFILASCALCFYACRRLSVARAESFVAAGLLYAGLLFYSTPVASPNALGLFLFLAAIIIPWVNNFSTRSLCVTLVLGVLAFYTKQYFVACLGYVALYLFLAISKKRAIYFGIAALLAFVAALALVIYTSPYYLENTVFAIQGSTLLAASDSEVVRQLKGFGEIYLPVLVILAVAVIYKTYLKISAPKQSEPGSSNERFVNVSSFEKPLLGYKPNYLWLCCVCSLIIFVLVLGKNRGNYLTYLFQLVSPFLLVGIFAFSSDMPKWRWPFKILIIIAMYKSYAMLPSDFSVKEDGWKQVREEISVADDVYASTLFIPDVMEKGGPVYLTGHTRYFLLATIEPDFLIKSKPEHRVVEIWAQYTESIQAKIENREFDLLLIDQWMPLPTADPASVVNPSEVDTLVLLRANYTRTDTVSVAMANRLGGGTHRIELWKPKKVQPGPG